MSSKSDQNRLEVNLSELAKRLELPYKRDRDGLGGDIGLPGKNEILTVGYTFDELEDSYEFGSKLGNVPTRIRKDFSQAIIQSEPIEA